MSSIELCYVRAMRRTSLIVLFVLFAACRTAPTTTSESSRQMMGLDEEPLAADWLEWTPRSGPSTPTQLATASTAFDFWQVTDVEQRESAWAAIFGLLSEVRRVAPREYESTLRMLMTVLEPQMGDGEQHLDATFFAGKPGGAAMFEGVGWRLWRELSSGATPGVTVWMRRYEASPDKPIEAFVWIYGGFEQTKSLTLRLDGTNGWAMSLNSGIGTVAETPISGEAQLVHAILLETFWLPVVGPQYLETAIEKREPAIETPPQQPVALGLPLGDRDIDQVFTDSVFTPRLTVLPTKRPSD